MAACRDVTRDLTLAGEVPLSTYRRAQIALHLMMCRHCRRHKAQLQQMLRLLQAAQSQEPDADDSLPAEARARIGDKLRQR